MKKTVFLRESRKINIMPSILKEILYTPGQCRVNGIQNIAKEICFLKKIQSQ